jgi:hypothetical protein
MSENALLVASLCADDYAFFQRVFGEAGRTILSVETCQEALDLVGHYDVGIVITEQTLAGVYWEPTSDSRKCLVRRGLGARPRLTQVG